MIKIAIVGKMGSGKSFVSNYIISYFHQRKITIQKLAFANKVYDIAYNLFGMKEKNRFLLQSIGTKMREINENIWVNNVIKDINENNYEGVVVEDGRYANEITTLKKNGFIIIRLLVDSDVQLERLKMIYSKESFRSCIKNMEHHSETSMNKINLASDLFDYVILSDENVLYNIDTILETEYENQYQL